MIEYNTSNGCNSGPNGNVPIWWENGECTIAQFNEVYNSGASESKEDSQAFDADVNATLNYIQYNYTHDNPSGAFFECALGTKYTTHIRYNISQNDGYGTNSYGGGAIVTIGGYSSVPGCKMYVYNNDFYLSEGHDSYITNNWDGITVDEDNYIFKNNVIYSDANSKGWHPNLKGTAENNAYGGSDGKITRDDDKGAVSVTKEDFQALGSGSVGSRSADGYKLSSGSACKNAGVLISDNGGRDYWGNAVSAEDRPNIGADNSGADFTEMQGVIDFEDRSTEDASLDGEYKGCTFSSGWNTKEADGTKVLYLSDNVSSGTIKLPKGKTLKSFTARCDSIARITVTANGSSKSFCAASANNRFDTGFESASDEVEISVRALSGSSRVYLDNLRLIDAEYARNNLALGKPVETSGTDQYPGSYGNDGDEDTMWIHSGEELNQWWTVDLGKDYDLSDFELIFEKEETEGAWGYLIEGKKSKETDFDSVPLYDGSDNTDGARIQTGKFKPGSIYRYLRVKITKFPGADYWPAFAEFKVYERECSNLALHKPVTTSAAEERPGSNGNDGDTSTLWVADGQAVTNLFPQWWTVDLGDVYDIRKYELFFEDDKLPGFWKYNISVSTDNKTYTEIDQKNDSKDGSRYEEKVLPEAVKGRYVRVTLTGAPEFEGADYWPAIAEFKVYEDTQ